MKTFKIFFFQIQLVNSELTQKVTNSSQLNINIQFILFFVTYLAKIYIWCTRLLNKKV